MRFYKNGYGPETCSGPEGGHPSTPRYNLIHVDFAISEHIGRFQVGLAGLYAFQVEDDRLFGVPIPPDGHETKVLSLGGVLAYDLPEIGGSLKIETLSTVIERNTVRSPFGVAVGWIKKF